MVTSDSCYLPCFSKLKFPAEAFCGLPKGFDLQVCEHNFCNNFQPPHLVNIPHEHTTNQQVSLVKCARLQPHFCLEFRSPWLGEISQFVEE